MNADMHVDELAEAYALGALARDEQARVTEHIAHCTPCRRRVGEAEETLLALERVVRPVKPPADIQSVQRRRAVMWWPAVAAAALIVGLLLPRPFAAPQNPALLAMIHSHFSHAQFIGIRGAPAAKVVYARDRSWLYVIVEGAHRYGVYGFDGRGLVPLGATQPRGEASDLYVTAVRSFRRVELREDDRIIETAAIR